MASAHELARGRKRLRALIEFALGEGWRVVRTSGGHLKFTGNQAARRSTPVRRRATTVPTAMPARRFAAAPTGRRRRTAVAELTPRDMAAKLLATGFSAAALRPRP